MSEKLKHPDNFIVYGDWFYKRYVLDFWKTDLKVKERLNDQTIKLGDENISPRVLSHWQEFGLISDDRPNGKGWRRFSVSEVVWIKIIIKLRKFGLDLDKIKKVKEYLDTYKTKKNQSKSPFFDFYICHTMLFPMPIKLIVFDSGECLLARQIDIDIAKDLRNIQDDYISIDLNKIVPEAIKKKNVATDYFTYSLSKLDKEIHNIINFEDIKSLVIKGRSNDEYLISKEFIVESKQELNELLKKLQYAEIKTTKRGKTQIHTITEKKKIKKY